MSFPLVAESGYNWFGPNCWWFRLWILLRALFGATSLLFKFSSLNYISLANSTIIGLSSPIFVFIFARIFLKEPFGRYHAISLCLSVVGVGFASKIGPFLLGSKATAVTTNASIALNTTLAQSATTAELATFSVNIVNVASAPYDLLVGNMYALLATILGSTIFILIRKVSLRAVDTAASQHS